MGTFLLVFFIVIVLMTGMCIGIIFGRKPISGTCGGIGALGMGTACDICGGNTQKCEEASQQRAGSGPNAQGLAYDADTTR
jgi:hypothetical protein